VHKAGASDPQAQRRIIRLAPVSERKTLAEYFDEFGARVCSLLPGDAFGHKGLLQNVPRFAAHCGCASCTPHCRSVYSNVWVIILCRNATCITAQQSELIILSRESVDLVQAMATESAVFSMQSCMRLLKKPPNSRTKNDLLFLSYNLVPALPFLRNMPDFVSTRLVQWLRLREVKPGDVLSRQGDPADVLHVVLRGELRGYQRKQATLTISDVVRLAGKFRLAGMADGEAMAAAAASVSVASASTTKRAGAGEPTTVSFPTMAAVLKAGQQYRGAQAARAATSPSARSPRRQSSPRSPRSPRWKSPQSVASPKASVWVDHALEEERAGARAGFDDLVGLRPHPVFGELVCSFIAHDVACGEAGLGDVGVKFDHTVVAVRDSQVLTITRNEFMRVCCHLRHRLRYAPARCRTTLMLPPRQRTPAQLEVVQKCLKRMEVRGVCVCVCVCVL